MDFAVSMSKSSHHGNRLKVPCVKGVRGNVKCIYDSLCRRVFVRE